MVGEPAVGLYFIIFICWDHNIYMKIFHIEEI
jgi:hypothetical protein